MSIISDAEARDIVGAAATDTLVPILRPLVERAVEARIGWEIERATYTKYYPQEDRGAQPEYFPGTFGVVPMGGNNTQVLRLSHKFVLLSGLQVWESAGAYYGQAVAYDSTHLLTLGDHYVLDTADGVVSEGGHVRRTGAYWPRQPGSIKVTYTAGFSADELDASGGTTDASDIRLACLLQFQKAYAECAAWRKGAGESIIGPKTMESVPGYTYTQNVAVATAMTGMVNLLSPEVEQLIHRYRRYDL